LRLRVATAPVLIPIAMTGAFHPAMLLRHATPAAWSPSAQGRLLAKALLTPPSQPAAVIVRGALADLRLAGKHVQPLRLFALAATVYLPMPGAPIF
jgi:hypothetical protein